MQYSHLILLQKPISLIHPTFSLLPYFLRQAIPSSLITNQRYCSNLNFRETLHFPEVQIQGRQIEMGNNLSSDQMVAAAAEYVCGNGFNISFEPPGSHEGHASHCLSYRCTCWRARVSGWTFGFKHFYGLDLASVAWQVLENMKMAVAGKMPR